MSDNLQDMNSSELLALIRQKAISDPSFAKAAKAQGIDVEMPDAPPELQELLNQIEQDLTNGIKEMDADVQKAIARVKPAFVMEVGIDMQDPAQPHRFHLNLKDVEGKAGSGKVFLDENGGMWYDRTSYIQEGLGEHVADPVVSRQVGDPELKKAVLDSDGVPRWWYNRKAKENDYKGEPISDSFIEKVIETNDLS